MNLIEQRCKSSFDSTVKQIEFYRKGMINAAKDDKFFEVITCKKEVERYEDKLGLLAYLLSGNVVGSKYYKKYMKVMNYNRWDLRD